MQKAAALNALCCIHAENGSAIDIVVAQMLAEGKTAPHFHAHSRSPKAEAEATHRAIALADMTGAAVYIVHLSNEYALAELKHMQQRGARALAETCTQYLVLAPERFVALTSTEPARIFGMEERKGSLAPGKDADVLLWDPAADYTIRVATQCMPTDYNMFEGWTVKGNAAKVFPVASWWWTMRRSRADFWARRGAEATWSVRPMPEASRDPSAFERPDHGTRDDDLEADGTAAGVQNAAASGERF